MKVVKIIGGIILFLLIVITVLIVTGSTRCHIERSIVIQAPAEKIFPYVNSFKYFKQWSPFAELDTTAKYTYDGPIAGVGAKMSWEGNKDIGQGTQCIIQSQPNKMVRNALSFSDMEGGMAIADFTLTPAPEGTKLCWTFDSDCRRASLTKRIMGKFFSRFMDRMLGPTYEKGLNKLKQVVETTPATSEQPLP